jgi:hypothetical protein
MSKQAQAVLDAHRLLPREDQLAVYETLARSSIPDEYGELSDEELTAIAAQSFALLDDEEARAKAR